MDKQNGGDLLRHHLTILLLVQKCVYNEQNPIVTVVNLNIMVKKTGCALFTIIRDVDRSSDAYIHERLDIARASTI